MQHSESRNNADQAPAAQNFSKLLRSARSLLGSMTGHNVLETASQVTALTNQVESESRKNLWDGIIGLIFRRATRDTINPLETTKLCAQLCRHLTQASSDPELSQFPKEHSLDHHIFGLCINSLPPSGGPVTLVQKPLSIMPGSAQHSQNSTRSNDNIPEYPPAERTTFFVAELYRESVLTIPQVHEYVERLIASGASMEERASGLCRLMAQHGQTLDRDPWKHETDSYFRWIDTAATDLAGKRIATRLKAVMRLRTRSWETGLTKFELVGREVYSLLKRLTWSNFDSASDRIIECANKSEEDRDGTTLMIIIRLVFEQAKDRPAFSEMYARLCRKMFERISPNVQDETLRGADGQPITGGALLRKYLLNRCQEDFERGWSAKEAAAAVMATKSGDDKVIEDASQCSSSTPLDSDADYVAVKAKQHALGVVRFIGELFKMQMITERIMHECIKKLLSNAVNPEEEEIESLCKLLTAFGHSLDNAKARNHMDIYFERMQEMARGSNISSRIQHMLQDVIQLRARHWQDNTTNVPSIATSRRGYGRGIQRGRGAFTLGLGEHRGGYGLQADGWNVTSGTSAARPPAKAGDLSQFGKISKPASTLSFGPSSVFSKKDPKREASLSRANSSANMFSALSAAGSYGSPLTGPAARGAGSWRPSVDLGPGGAPAVEGSHVRKRLNLLPRSKPTDAEAEAEKGEEKEEAEPTLDGAGMSEADVQKKVKEDIKEYLSVENVEEAIMALEELPLEHRHIFVDKMVTAALDGGNKVVVLAEKLFSAAHKQEVCTSETFDHGLLPTVEIADDVSIDVPKTYEWLARLMHAASLDNQKVEELAGKIAVLGESKVQPRELLAQEFAKLSA